MYMYYGFFEIGNVSIFWFYLHYCTAAKFLSVFRLMNGRLRECLHVWHSTVDSLIYVRNLLTHYFMRGTTHKIKLLPFILILLKCFLKVLISRPLANSWSRDLTSIRHFTLLSTRMKWWIYNNDFVWHLSG